jgi:squalene-hopene/tetraprenyl-beta-curcumene cyclase
MNPRLAPGGWAFEYRNGFYPDTDDTAMVLMGLARTVRSGQQAAGSGQRAAGSGQWAAGRDDWPRNGHVKTLGIRTKGYSLSTAHCPLPTDLLPAAQRAISWLLGMQNSDGGWAAFDRDINREVLTQIPFADHNAMLDPSCPDITARVLEGLAQYGYQVGRPEVDRAVAFIRRSQDPRGCWPGRWGVNYLYGTWQVLQGLEAVGFDRKDVMVRRAAQWLKQVQQPGGPWGESCRSYDDPALAGQGAPTASQTAWALLGLMAAGEVHSPEVHSGVNWLLATQRPDGTWHETPFTGTGFPRVFYLKYHLYSLYFPLMALGKYEQAVGIRGQESGIRGQESGIRSQESGIRGHKQFPFHLARNHNGNGAQSQHLPSSEP